MDMDMMINKFTHSNTRVSLKKDKSQGNFNRNIVCETMIKCILQE